MITSTNTWKLGELVERLICKQVSTYSWSWETFPYLHKVIRCCTTQETCFSASYPINDKKWQESGRGTQTLKLTLITLRCESVRVPKLNDEKVRPRISTANSPLVFQSLYFHTFSDKPAARYNRWEMNLRRRKINHAYYIYTLFDKFNLIFIRWQYGTYLLSLPTYVAIEQAWHDNVIQYLSLYLPVE